jgi:hypothetical protein
MSPMPHTQGAKKAYSLLRPYLHLCEPHFDALVGEARQAAERGVQHARTRSAAFIAERAGDVATLVRALSVCLPP